MDFRVLKQFLKETKNRSDFLEQMINLINPKIIVTLRAVALEGSRLIAYHNHTLKLQAAFVQEWKTRLLFALCRSSSAGHRSASSYAAEASRFSSFEKSV